MAGEWLEVDPSEINEGDKGVAFHVYVSPYDVPEAVRGFYDKATDRFVIEFRYISGDEPLKLHEEHSHVRFFSGVRSERLRRIELDVKAMNVDQVSVDVLTAMKRLKSPNRLRKQNYATVKRLVDRKRNSLFSSVSR